MQAAILLLGGLAALNGAVLAVGRALGIIAIGAMVIAILVQVFFRYVLGNALPWPDEAARFCMLWMTGLMAPSAFRSGGFVAIDMLSGALPSRVGAILGLFLLGISALVLFIAVQIGLSEVSGIGGRFATASLYVPTSFDFSSWYRVPRSWMMLSLLVGVCLLFWVNVELLLRALFELFAPSETLPPIAPMTGAE